jgi:hydroxymethylbilane synthase
MSNGGAIRLATRGSDLALRQAATVREALAERRYDVEVVEVQTRGDEIRDELIHRLGKTGAFVRALDEEVLDGEADLAVHSMKDVPTETPEDLVTVAVPERGTPGDVLVTPEGTALADLPDGATVGTASQRRTAQLLRARPDLDVRPLRGNVDTRIEKLLAPSLQREHERRTEEHHRRKAAAGEELPPGVDRESVAPSEDDYEFPYDRTVEEWFEDRSEIERRALERDPETEFDAVVLAEVGLKRSGLAHHLAYVRLPLRTHVPAPAQGALAIVGEDTETTRAIRGVLDHPRSRVETTAERTVLATVGGGCIAPIGVYAVVQGEYVETTAQVLSTDGEAVVEASRDLPVDSYGAAAREFGADLVDRGAAELIEAAREDGDGGGEGTRE